MNQVTPQKLLEDVKILIDDLEELLSVTADQANERVRDLRRRIVDTMEECKKTLAAEDKSWFQKAEQITTGAESYFRQNPWSKVVFAAGIGVVLGLLLRRD